MCPRTGPAVLEVRCWLVLELFFGRQYARGLEQAQGWSSSNRAITLYT